MSILACLFILALIPSYASSISFNFTNITPENAEYIVLTGDAAYSPEEGIQVTHKRNDYDFLWLTGRATYIKPLHLWDSKSADLASFSTSFTFVIDSYPRIDHSDGLTFFLAQKNFVKRGGGSLGLPSNSTFPFVAVEFDSFGGNDWDPKYPDGVDDHVGIDINSLKSVASQKWYNNIASGKECRALVNYCGDSKNLSVSFTNIINNSQVWETGLHYTVDLRKVLPEWVIFGFSASIGTWFEKNNVKSWTFNSTEFKADEINGPAPTRIRNVMKGIYIAWTVVLVILSAINAFFFWRMKIINAFFFWRTKKNDKVEEHGFNLEMNNEFERRASIPRRFSYLELAESTANFAATEKLGEGGFGGVYKGFLKDLSTYVAVKRVSNTSSQGIKEYASEVRIISRLRHRNLVQLTGWCHDKGELLLVYEFLEKGSLDLHLFRGKSLLTWNTRFKISLGLASALLYLHEGWEQCVLHRDVKSSNVMLDSNFNPKLGDFGLAKLVDHEKSSQTTMVAGTIGYMAPEYVTTGKASKESDVFSFGVVALEIACGRKSLDPHAEERKKNLVEWVWHLYGNGTLLKAVDPCLGQNFEEEEMRCLIIVGLWCAHPDLNLRPSMKQAIQVLNFEASLPILPSSMTYLTSSALPHFSSYCSSLSSNSNRCSSKY